MGYKCVWVVRGQENMVVQVCGGREGTGEHGVQVCGSREGTGEHGVQVCGGREGDRRTWGTSVWGS